MIVAHSGNDDPADGLPLRRVRTAITQRIDRNCAIGLHYTTLAHASPYGMFTMRRAERTTQLPLRAQHGLLSSVHTSFTVQSVLRIIFFFVKPIKGKGHGVFMAGGCLHSFSLRPSSAISRLSLQHFLFSSHLYISFVASFRLFLFPSHAHWGKAGKAQGTNAIVMHRSC